MTTISNEYKALNKELHRTQNNFGSGGWKRAKKVWEEFIQPNGAIKLSDEVLDYGCGKGTFAKEIWYTYKFWIDNYDPCVQEYSDRPENNSYAAITCLDVLEHVEPELLTEVLNDLKSIGISNCLYYFNVALVPSNKILADGRNAHLIVRPADWWVGQFKGNGFEVIKAEYENQGPKLEFLNCILKKVPSGNKG